MLWSIKKFQHENHALLNPLHESGYKSTVIIVKHFSAIYDTTYRENSMQHHSY